MGSSVSTSTNKSNNNNAKTLPSITPSSSSSSSNNKNSKNNNNNHNKKRELEEMAHLMMPVYYNANNLTLSQEEYRQAMTSWRLIQENRAPEFLRKRCHDPLFNFTTSIGFFCHNFYSRFFDIHPHCSSLYHNIDLKSQGKCLVLMIHLALSAFAHSPSPPIMDSSSTSSIAATASVAPPATNTTATPVLYPSRGSAPVVTRVHQQGEEERFDETLRQLAMNKAKMGVRSVEYGIMGEVLFWALNATLGSTTYNSQLHSIWVRIFSRLLRVIIPVALRLEIDGEIQERVFQPNPAACPMNHLHHNHNQQQHPDIHHENRDNNSQDNIEKTIVHRMSDREYLGYDECLPAHLFPHSKHPNGFGYYLGDDDDDNGIDDRLHPENQTCRFYPSHTPHRVSQDYEDY